MSSADLSYARARTGKAAQAQKSGSASSRQKLLLAGGGVLLLLLVAVQVPRILDALSADEAAVAPPAVAVPEAAPVPVPGQAAPAPATSPETRAQIERIQRDYTAKDPFAARAVSGASQSTRVRPAPAGARDPFARRTVGAAGAESVPVVGLPGVRDPFTQATVPVEVAPAPPPAPEPVPVTTDRLRGYTIILVSVPVRSGRPAAVQAAAAARARGVPGVAVLRSSDYATLRPGYFAVYSRVFETRAAAERAVGGARALGYPKAYVRPLGR